MNHLDQTIGKLREVLDSLSSMGYSREDILSMVEDQYDQLTREVFEEDDQEEDA